MEYIYEAMDQTKEAIEKSFNEREEKYKEIFEIIDQRWNVNSIGLCMQLAIS